MRHFLLASQSSSETSRRHNTDVRQEYPGATTPKPTTVIRVGIASASLLPVGRQWVRRQSAELRAPSLDALQERIVGLRPGVFLRGLAQTIATPREQALFLAASTQGHSPVDFDTTCVYLSLSESIWVHLGSFCRRPSGSVSPPCTWLAPAPACPIRLQYAISLVVA